MLSRKEQEKIILSNGVEILVIDIGSNQVRIGIQAPDDVDIYREEVWLKKQLEDCD